MKDALNGVLNDIGYPVALMALDGKVIQQNAASLRFSTQERSAAGERQYCPFLHESDGTAVISGFTEIVAKTGKRQERELVRFNRWWQVHLAPVLNDQGQVVRLLLLAQDINALKEEQEARLAHEKALSEALVREVHHRMKNHLQGLVGLLRSHPESWRTVREVIDNAVVQIQSIAAVHALQAKNGVTIEFSALVGQIIANLRLGSPIPINCHLPESAAWDLAKEDAVPLAIAIGELLTNAVKHTPVSSKAHVDGTLTCTDDDVELVLVNSPAQLPEGFDLTNPLRDSTGLELVRSLMPRDVSELTITQDAEEVTTYLRLRKARGDRQTQVNDTTPPLF